MRISRQILTRMSEIERSLDRLDVAVITRYPDSQRAAESYDALRKGIITNASAATVSQQNLITLANAIDQGATASTLRLKIIDLLGTYQVREITSDEFIMNRLDEATYVQVFQEVGDSAHPRPAWIRWQGEALEIVQKGYVKAYPDFTEVVQDSKEPEAIEVGQVPENPTTPPEPPAAAEIDLPSANETPSSLDRTE